ncbi:Exodeoxyribonuclease 7 large subunit [compost metagenome]
MDEIVQQEERSISEEELQRYELIKKKIQIGSKDLETMIRDKMLKDEKILIANIYGNNAIVQKDFFEGLDVSRQYFQIDDHSCNITSSTAIISKIHEVSALDYDIIALVRGGGDRQSMETFNDVTLSEIFIKIKMITVTAIGHTVDETLLDKLADKRFHLPHDYGAGLHTIAEKLSHERSNSRALLIDEVKKDVAKQFSEQVETLEKQLKKKNEEFTEAQKIYKEQSEAHNKTYADQLKVRNEEFQKLQVSSGKQLEDLQKNFQEQQKHRLVEMESYKKEIVVLHEKNVQSAINEKTFSLRTDLETAKQANMRLIKELEERNTDHNKLIIVFIVALIIGLAIAKVFF